LEPGGLRRLIFKELLVNIRFLGENKPEPGEKFRTRPSGFFFSETSALAT
jgi:hypothetical protein